MSSNGVLAATAAAFLLAVNGAAYGGDASTLNAFLQAVGMPGNLGIAGLDALRERCDGKRDPAWRSQMMDLVDHKMTNDKYKKMTAERYDKQYGQVHSSLKDVDTDHYCSEDYLELRKKGIWAKYAAKIGYPGF